MEYASTRALKTTSKVEKRRDPPAHRVSSRALITLTHSTNPSDKNERLLACTNNYKEISSLYLRRRSVLGKVTRTSGHENCIVLVVHRIDTFTNRRKTFISRAYRVILRRHKTILPWPPLMTTMLRSTQMDFDGCTKHKKNQLGITYSKTKINTTIRTLTRWHKHSFRSTFNSAIILLSSFANGQKSCLKHDTELHVGTWHNRWERSWWNGQTKLKTHSVSET